MSFKPHLIVTKDASGVRPRREDGVIERFLLEIEGPGFLCLEGLSLGLNEGGKGAPSHLEFLVFPYLLVLVQHFPIVIGCATLTYFRRSVSLVEVLLGNLFAGIVIDNECTRSSYGDLCEDVPLIVES